MHVNSSLPIGQAALTFYLTGKCHAGLSDFVGRLLLWNLAEILKLTELPSKKIYFFRAVVWPFSESPVNEISLKMYYIHCTCISPQRLQLNAILVTSGLTLLTLTTVPRIATNLPRMVTKIIRDSRLYLVNCVRIGHLHDDVILLL